MSVLASIVDRSISGSFSSEVFKIGDYAFNSCKGLASVSFPKATDIGNGAFQGCNNLTEVSFPNATSIGEVAFNACTSLTSASFPNATSIGDYAFYKCSNLTTIYVGTNTSTVCTLPSINVFGKCTNLANIYVPASLVDSYKSTTGWSNYADKIKAAP